ncbi:MAG: MotA/TolQ/ExbB proton channel family protein [Alphaproteobacteria bacterium]
MSSGNVRIFVTVGSLIAGLTLVILLGVLLPSKSFEARFLIDKNPTYYPWTIQNLMWLVFFFGLGELLLRFFDGRADSGQLTRHYLPEDERTVLRASDLGGIYANVKDSARSEELFMPRLIRRVILQFQSNRSVAQANSLLNSSLELYMHEIDLRYNMLRYIMWLVPSLGFIGTVIGIALALNFAGAETTNFQDPKLLSQLTDRLGVAFYTTLLALLQAAILVFFMHLTQAREERALNRTGQYCMDNLINRLYER